MKPITLAEWLQPSCSVPSDVFQRSVSALTSDSRQVESGGAYVALPGLTTHGDTFIEDAVKRGARYIVQEAASEVTDAQIEDKGGYLLIKIPQLKERIPKLAARFFGDPSKQMKVIGVTGTNGKTTVTHFIAEAFTRLGERAGIIGTIGYGLWGALKPATHTTPDGITLQRMLAELRDAGARYVAMEVSSHGLAQGRVKGVTFRAGVFTNLTQDHLDYHGTMEAYGDAKRRLFKEYSLEYAVINRDDPFGAKLINVLSSQSTLKCFDYGLDSAGGTVHGKFSDGDDQTWRISSALLPLEKFNVSNMLATFAVLICEGKPNPWGQTSTVSALQRLSPVPGRMERHEAHNKPTVIIDYAHTPDALKNVLIAAREYGPNAKLWCVFGCGGDRDKSKRALMGENAAEYADHIVLTDDNPRHEAPEAIVADILSDISDKKKALVHVEHDRPTAIQYAISAARPGDVVVIAGKGHEQYQQIGDDYFPMSDADIVKKALS